MRFSSLFFEKQALQCERASSQPTKKDRIVVLHKSGVVLLDFFDVVQELLDFGIFSSNRFFLEKGNLE